MTEKSNSFVENLRNAINSVVKETTDRVIRERLQLPEMQKKIDPSLLEKNVVEYTYKPGDTFGQVIKNLGLDTDAGLWGPNGDVAFYTQQLSETGKLDSRGNIPVGTRIKLLRRHAPMPTVLKESDYINIGKPNSK